MLTASKTFLSRELCNSEPEERDPNYRVRRTGRGPSSNWPSSAKALANSTSTTPEILPYGNMTANLENIDRFKQKMFHLRASLPLRP